GLHSSGVLLVGNRYYFLRAKVSLLARHHLGPETSAEKSLRSQRAIAHAKIRAGALDSRHLQTRLRLETTNSAVRGSLVGAERVCCAYFPPTDRATTISLKLNRARYSTY